MVGVLNSLGVCSSLRSPASAWGFDWDAPPLSAKSDDSASSKRIPSPSSLLFASSARSSSPSLSQMGARLRPIFAPVTRVINPLVVRAMAEVVRRSTLWGALFGRSALVGAGGLVELELLDIADDAVG